MKNGNKGFYILLVVLPLLKGLYFYHHVYFGIVLTIGILAYSLWKQRVWQVDKGLAHYLFGGMVLSALVTYPLALDKGMALFGVLKVIGIYLFYLLTVQMEVDKYREIYLRWIACSGILLSVIGLGGLLNDQIYPIVVQNQRLGSLIQYPNTLAVWLLVAILIISFFEEINKRYMTGLTLLWGALFLTYSRSVFILALIFSLVAWLNNKEHRLKLFSTLGLGIVLGLILMLCKDLTQSFERIEATSFKVSEWKTRLIYYKDGLRLLRDHPMGLGHLGYFYSQRLYQSAVYYVKYIHNGFLQLALDYGVPAMIAFILLGLKGLMSRETSKRDRLIIILIYGHGIIDFDFQFFILWILLILLISYNSLTISLNKFAFSSICIIMTMCISMYTYFGGVTYAQYVGDYDTAIKYYPLYTEAKKSRMIELYRTGQEVEAFSLSKEILKDNAYVLEAWLIQRDWYVAKGAYELAADAIGQAMVLDPMNSQWVESYVELLALEAKQALLENQTEKAKQLLRRIIEIQAYVLVQVDRIDQEAYTIQHPPNYRLTNALTEHIQWAKDQLSLLNGVNE